MHNCRIRVFIAFPALFITGAPSLIVYILELSWSCAPQGVEGEPIGVLSTDESDGRSRGGVLASVALPPQQPPPELLLREHNVYVKRW